MPDGVYIEYDAKDWVEVALSVTVVVVSDPVRLSNDEEGVKVSVMVNVVAEKLFTLLETLAEDELVNAWVLVSVCVEVPLLVPAEADDVCDSSV